MTYGAETISSHDRLQTAATMMKRGGYRKIPVVDDDKLVASFRIATFARTPAISIRPKLPPR